MNAVSMHAFRRRGSFLFVWPLLLSLLRSLAWAE